MAIYDEVRGGYRVFIGDLGSRIDRSDLDREFKYFGTLLDVWVARNPPGFGFVVFKNADDAERAVKKLHGRSLCGRRVRVEHAFETGAKDRRMTDSVRFRGGSSRWSRSRSRDRRRSPSYESQRRSTTSRRRSPSDEPRLSRSKRQSPESRLRYDRSRNSPLMNSPLTNSPLMNSPRILLSHSIPRNSHRQASRSPERKGARKNHRDSASGSRSRSRSASRKKAAIVARSGSSND